MEEIKKLTGMSIILFLFMFNHCILWNMKDTLVVVSSGAEVIPFIKVWAIMPGAILFTFCFIKLSNRYTQQQIFYLIVSTFLLFFGLFTFLIYPYRDQLHPLASAQFLQNMLPAGFKGLISMYRYWTFTCFYTMCELWNTIVITVIFWGFVNGTLHEGIAHGPKTTRPYTVFTFIANLAVVIAGTTAFFISKEDFFPSIAGFGITPWEQTMTYLTLFIIASGLIAMGVFYWMNRGQIKENGPRTATKTKEKVSLYKSMLHVCSSKYLVAIAVIVVAYNLIINLSEVIWKDQLKNMYPEMLSYNHHLSKLQALQGVIAIILSLSLTQMIRRLGWAKTALVTPVIMTISCILFFSSMFFHDSLNPFFLTFISVGPLAMAVFFGSLQNCMSKACKTSLFDATKEMTYLPLSEESKLKAKAAIDGIGARFGKSGSSLIHQGLLFTFATLSASVPYIAIIVLAALACWIVAIRKIGTNQSNYA